MIEVVEVWSIGVVTVCTVLWAVYALCKRYKTQVDIAMDIGSHAIENAFSVASTGISTAIGLGMVYAACVVFYRIGRFVVDVLS